MPSQNPKRKTGWMEPTPELGVDVPELKFFKDPGCTQLHDFQFPLTDRGQTVELAFYMRNMSEKTIYDVRLEAKAEPDEGWPSKKGAVGPMYLQLEPSEVSEVKPGYVVSGKLTWPVEDDAKCDKRRASILMTGRFTE